MVSSIRNNFLVTKISFTYTYISFLLQQLNYVLDSVVLHEWPQLLLETNELSQERTYYKIGEPVLLYNLDANEIIEYGNLKSLSF